MAQFYGTVQGARGEASRLGGKGSGLRTRAASWSGAIEVSLTDRDGTDWATVTMTQHHGHGRYLVLYDGPVAGTGPSAEHVGAFWNATHPDRDPISN